MLKIVRARSKYPSFKGEMAGSSLCWVITVSCGGVAAGLGLSGCCESEQVVHHA